MKKCSKPLISVIIPTYNRESTIKRSIQSVISQTYHNIEVIVVDDASTDNTQDILKSIYDKRLFYIKHDKRKGASAARNTGIRKTNGDLIAFQDSDDKWWPEKLEKQMKAFENTSHKIGVVYTGFYRKAGGQKEYIPNKKISKKNGFIEKELLKGNFITTQSILIRKECLENSGMFDESLPRLQDWELVLRVSKAYNFICVDEPLLTSYLSIDSISTNQDALITALKIIIKKHYDLFKKDRKSLSEHYYTLGSLLCDSGENKNGQHYLIKSILTYPINIKSWRTIIASFMGLLKLNQ